jgi:hypothetical protein
VKTESISVFSFDCLIDLVLDELGQRGKQATATRDHTASARQVNAEAA